MLATRVAYHSAEARPLRERSRRMLMAGPNFSAAAWTACHRGWISRRVARSLFSSRREYRLPVLLDFAKNTLRARTYLGHTNGSRLPIPNLDGANVGLKAWDEKVHLAYTGRPKQPIFDNFAAAFRAGLELKANVVYVPGLVDLDQVEAIAAWLATLSRDIPFHIMGYIPVPGQTYARPTEGQMELAVQICRKHLSGVASSHLSSQEALDLTARDDRFASRQIA
jgi:pyruvate formate lyase activating enzyme